MEWFTAPDYWLSRLVLQRGLACLYLVAFLGAAPSRKVLIVQARPYSLTWSGDRRWRYAP